MRLPREPFSWDGDDEPTPLDDFERPDVDILEDAEAVVREAQQGLARENTDPYMTIPSGSGPGNALTRTPRPGRSLNPAARRPMLAVLLSAICVAAFAHGWTTGASADTCGRTHCQDDKFVTESREERRR